MINKGRIEWKRGRERKRESKITHTQRVEDWDERNLRIVMFSTVTFVPTYNNICTIYDNGKNEVTYLYNIGYPDAITFLNGI